MGISMGSGGQTSVSEINMTPMIDVLLVLIVIFMIAQPLLQKSIDVQIPKEEPSEQQADPVPPIVLEIEEGGVYRINTQAVTIGQLEDRLREIYTARPSKVLFVKASPDVIYQDVIEAMDAARGAGVEVLGAVMD